MKAPKEKLINCRFTLKELELIYAVFESFGSQSEEVQSGLGLKTKKDINRVWNVQLKIEKLFDDMDAAWTQDVYVEMAISSLHETMKLLRGGYVDAAYDKIEQTVNELEIVDE